MIEDQEDKFSFNAEANEFVPSFLADDASIVLRSNGKPKKTKEQRGPRKRTRHKNGQNLDESMSGSMMDNASVSGQSISMLSQASSRSSGPRDPSYFNIFRPSQLLSGSVSTSQPPSSSSSIAEIASGGSADFDRTPKPAARKSLSIPEILKGFEVGGAPSLFGWWGDLTGAAAAQKSPPSLDGPLPLVPEGGVEPVSWWSGLTGRYLSEGFFSSAAPELAQYPAALLPPMAQGSSGAGHMSAETGQWLQLQEEWALSKNRGAEEAEFLLEAAERRKWGEWAVRASEAERRRRVQILRDIEAEQEAERAHRRRWANEMIERERSERISDQFLATLASTQWFSEMISSYHEDYEIVCPYYRAGCRVSCTRSSIKRHLQACAFAGEQPAAAEDAHMEQYEVVCPNAVLGCPFTGHRGAVLAHLGVCAHQGLTHLQESEERERARLGVIQASEAERVRRLRDDTEAGAPAAARSALSGLIAGSSALSTAAAVPRLSAVQSLPQGAPEGQGAYSKRESALHGLLRTQMRSVANEIHDEVEVLWQRHMAPSPRKEAQQKFIASSLRQLQACVAQLWPFACVQVFGSCATGLGGLGSSGGDLDVVVCFSDECQELLSVRGSIPLLHALADHLQRRAQSFLRLESVLLHARIPVIKGRCIRPAGPEGDFAAAGEEGELSISIDISLDGPTHSGLATTELVRTLLQRMPPLGPVFLLLKRFLRGKQLCDAYTGGLPSYGLVILLLLPLLRHARIQAHQSLLEQVQEQQSSAAVHAAEQTSAVALKSKTTASVVTGADAAALTVLPERAADKGSASEEPLIYFASTLPPAAPASGTSSSHNMFTLAPPDTLPAALSFPDAVSPTAASTSALSGGLTVRHASIASTVSDGFSYKSGGSSRLNSPRGPTPDAEATAAASSNTLLAAATRLAALSENSPSGGATSTGHKVHTSASTAISGAVASTHSSLQSQRSRAASTSATDSPVIAFATIYPNSGTALSVITSAGGGGTRHSLNTPPRVNSSHSSRSRSISSPKIYKPVPVGPPAPHAGHGYDYAYSSYNNPNSFSHLAAPLARLKLSSDVDSRCRDSRTRSFGPPSRTEHLRGPWPAHGRGQGQSRGVYLRQMQSRSFDSRDREGYDTGGRPFYVARGASDNSFSFSSVEQQREFGRKVALKLLGEEIEIGSALSPLPPPPSSDSTGVLPGIAFTAVLTAVRRSSSNSSGHSLPLSSSHEDLRSDPLSPTRQGQMNGNLKSGTGGSAKEESNGPSQSSFSPDGSPAAGMSSGASRPPILSSARPIYGLIVEEFLKAYGEHMQCGRHGYSARDGGFRFDVHGTGDEGGPTLSHPQASDPLLVEDPVDVFNNVGRNCFRAPQLQRVLLEAHERLKAVVVRHDQQPRSSPRNQHSPSARRQTTSSSPTERKPSPLVPTALAGSNTSSAKSLATGNDSVDSSVVAVAVESLSSSQGGSRISLMRAKFEKASPGAVVNPAPAAASRTHTPVSKGVALGNGSANRGPITPTVASTGKSAPVSSSKIPPSQSQSQAHTEVIVSAESRTRISEARALFESFNNSSGIGTSISQQHSQTIGQPSPLMSSITVSAAATPGRTGEARAQDMSTPVRRRPSGSDVAGADTSQFSLIYEIFGVDFSTC